MKIRIEKRMREREKKRVKRNGKKSRERGKEKDRHTEGGKKEKCKVTDEMKKKSKGERSNQ